jgi:hypothetical protein
MAYTTIDDPTIYFTTFLRSSIYGGSDTSYDIGFQPDWIWDKIRSSTGVHALFDSVRGVGSSGKVLYAHLTNAEGTNALIKSIDSSGFTITASADHQSQTIVDWCWKAGTSFSNDASATSIGTIDSSGSVSTDAGFSIISYTGTGSAGTIAHGLGAVPSWIITKNRDATQPWRVYHKGVDASAPEDYGLILNDTSARDNDNTAWNDTAPTSSVFSVGSSANTNNSSDDFIAYCFTEIKGYSKFGSYIGNANTDGPYIHTGFKPAFFIYRNVETSTEEWKILDNKRDTFNRGSQRNLVINDNRAESDDTNSIGEFLSNGVKIRSSHNNINKSGNRYIFASFAESPFVNSSGIPNNAR